MSTRAAIITGAGSGIGRATALALSAAGYAVALAGRREKELLETASACGAALAVPADVSDPAAAQALAAAVLGRFGRIDALVNNAGFAPLVKVAEITDGQWRAIIDTNLSAAVYLSRACWPAFARQKGGAIVSISSESARDPFLGLGAYGAAKAGLNLLTKALAQEGREIGVRAYAVAPGAVETGMFRAMVSEREFGTDKTLSPEDVARVVVQCIAGDLVHASGEVIYINRRA